MVQKNTLKKCKNNASNKSTTLKKHVRTQKGGSPLLDVITSSESSRDIYRQVKQILKNNPDIDVNKEDDGVTPLYAASKNGHLDVARLLVEAGADIDKAKDNGYTSLHIASLWGHLEVVKYLVEQGADKDKATNVGRTPLYIASAIGRVDVVRVLLEQGADKDKTNNRGLTPVMIAEKEGHNEIVDILKGQPPQKRKRVDVNYADDEYDPNKQQKMEVVFDTCGRSPIIKKIIDDRNGNSDKGFLSVKKIIQNRLHKKNIEVNEENIVIEGTNLLTRTIRDRLRQLKDSIQNSFYKEQLNQRILWFKDKACSDLIIEKIFGSKQSYSDYFKALFRTKDFNDNILDTYAIKFRTKESGMEKVTAQKQCETAFGYKIKNIEENEKCYICGHYLKKYNDHQIDCEHILPIETALSHISIVQDKYKKIDEYLKMEYKWSHKCCNLVKGDIDMIVQRENSWEVDIDNIEYVLRKIEDSNATSCKTIQNYGDVYSEENINKIITIVQPLVDIINANMENIGENYYRLYLFYKLLASFDNNFFTQLITGTWGERHGPMRDHMDIDGGSDISQLDTLFDSENDDINNIILSDIEGVYQDIDKQLEKNPNAFKPRYIKTTKTEYDEDNNQERIIVRFFPYDKHQELLTKAKQSLSIMPEFKPVKSYFSDDDKNIVYEFPTGNNPYGTFDIGAVENIKQSGSGKTAKRTVKKTNKSKKSTKKSLRRVNISSLLECSNEKYGCDLKMDKGHYHCYKRSKTEKHRNKPDVIHLTNKKKGTRKLKKGVLKAVDWFDCSEFN